MEKQQTSSRMVAFTAIVFSTVAVSGCLLAFPLVFHYIQTLEASVQSELDFCKTRSRDMWNEMMDIHVAGGQFDSARVARAMFVAKENEMRLKRGADKSHSLKWSGRVAKDQPQPLGKEPVANPSMAQQSGGCCTCHRGPAGPPGPPGRDGGDGAHGSPGAPGERGDPAPSDRSIIDNFPKQCPCEAPTGDAGPAGPKGPDGPAGDAGAPGGDGKPGEQGPKGPPGENGKAGANGQKGPSGDAGKTTSKVGPAGAPGGKGRDGAAGAPGQPGPAGKDGQPGGVGPAGEPGPAGPNGKPGPAGPDGDAGKQGDPGACNHCPPARLAPGY